MFFVILIQLICSMLVSVCLNQLLVTDIKHKYQEDPSTQYRSASKETTFLGSLSLPLSVLLKDGQLYGVDQNNQWHNFTINQNISQDRVRQIYLDIFTDRLFFIKDRNLHIYDFASGTDMIVGGDLQYLLQNESCGEESVNFGLDIPNCLQIELAGAHNNYVTFLIQNSETLITFDIISGDEITRTEAAGYDLIRGFEFFQADTKMRLTLNSKSDAAQTSQVIKSGSAYTRTSSLQMDHLDFYLEEVPNESIDLYISTQDPKWNDPIWTVGVTPALRDLTPIYSYTDSYSKTQGLLLGNLYRLDDQRLATEINGILAIINLKTRSVEIINDPIRIEDELQQAILLFSDQDDHMQWSSCNDTKQHNNYIYTLKTTDDYEYVFCLK